MARKIHFTFFPNDIYIKTGEATCREFPSDGDNFRLMPQAIPNLNTLKIYQPRNPLISGYYKCVESHFEELEQIWDDHYAPRFGSWREYVTEVIHRYLECGDLHFGFARVKCEECDHLS